MEPGRLDSIVQDYLQAVGINKHFTKWRLLGLRDNATHMECVAAFKFYVLLLHPDKHQFNIYLADHPEWNLTSEEVAICKAKLLDFYNMWVKNKEDLRMHDMGLCSKVCLSSVDDCS